MSGKGQAMISEIFVSLLTIALVGLLIVFFLTGNLDMGKKEAETEIETHVIILSNIVLSSPKLAYSQGDLVYRGVLDKNKLDSLKKDPDILFDEFSYPNSQYYIEVRDLDTRVSWGIGNKIPIAKKYPVAIRYDDENVHLGTMFVGLREAKK